MAGVARGWEVRAAREPGPGHGGPSLMGQDRERQAPRKAGRDVLSVRRGPLENPEQRVGVN